MSIPKLTLVCRILSMPQTISLVNGEYRTLLHIRTNGSEHHLEIISTEIWASDQHLSKLINLTLDVSMNNEHILIYQNPIWRYI